MKTLVQYPSGKLNEEYSMPNSVQIIGYGAFYNSKNLKNISIPNTVTTIEQDAFSWLSIENINIPSDLTSIGTTAFWACRELKTIEIPSKVTLIGTAAFGQCYKLYHVIISSSLCLQKNTLMTRCFNECPLLTELTCKE